MKNFGIITAILLLVGTFLYSLQLLSDNNVCTGVRSFACQKKQEQQKQLMKAQLREEILIEQAAQEELSRQNAMKTDTSDYGSLKKIGDSFVHLCNPIIIESTGAYMLDYSKCSLHLSVAKDKKTVQEVNVNGGKLEQTQVDENLAKFWFSF